ncbi:hypothetical protein GCM10025876_38070 [Demequina litorisediminis]|uniref:Uncharacterized protein n=1 Tax=Demequina litorisediminis TaxID=1849022 RepID=A0ABQ6IKD1_9MICO|nr:hypothetical protein GCM10025876_38070 [Demequina litorisediminis]
MADGGTRDVRIVSDQGILFDDGLAELDENAGYRGPTACKAAGITYRQARLLGSYRTRGADRALRWWIRHAAPLRLPRHFGVARGEAPAGFRGVVAADS